MKKKNETKTKYVITYFYDNELNTVTDVTFGKSPIDKLPLLCQLVQMNANAIIAFRKLMYNKDYNKLLLEFPDFDVELCVIDKIKRDE